MRSRSAVVNLAKSWLGRNEKDGSHKLIIDIYNRYKPQARGLKMQYTWSWCACTVSALAIQLGYTDIIPLEISCGEMINKAKIMGIWQENDGFVPQPGDFILYDWDDSGKGDNTGWPDHIGTVESVYESAGYFRVVEGNYNDAVKYRTVSINGKFIRGFICPRYDAETVGDVIQTVPNDIDKIVLEVISGKWGTGDERKSRLTAAGYNYEEVRKKVNEKLNGSATTSKAPEQNQLQPVKGRVTTTCSARNFDREVAGVYYTTADLYCRNDAGTNKKALCKIPKNCEVNCFGYYTRFNGIKWPLIQFIMDGILYTGFSSGAYLKKKV